MQHVNTKLGDVEWVFLNTPLYPQPIFKPENGNQTKLLHTFDVVFKFSNLINNTLCELKQFNGAEGCEVKPGLTYFENEDYIYPVTKY